MKRTTQTGLGGFAVALFLVFSFPSVAEAHALGAEAKLKDGKVIVESFYDDNSPAESAKIVITNGAGVMIAEGKTDKEGKWSFQSPPSGKYKITVDAGAGHRAIVNLTIPAVPNTSPPSITSGSSPVTPSPIPTDEEIIVSDGPTRSEFTGWPRVGLVVGGVFLIGAVTWVLTRVLRALEVKRVRERKL